MLNALDRLSGTYASQIDTTGAELAIAEGQLRDHEARIGRTFTHDAYLAELTALRDQLKSGLSQATPEPGSDQVPVAELAERIKSLKGGHTIDAAPERTVSRRIAAEVPVTARIRRRSETLPAALPSAGQTPLPPVETALSEAIVPEHHDELPSVIHPLPNPIPVMPASPQADYRQQVARKRREQLSLF